MTETLEGGRIMDPETGLIFPWYTSTCLEWLKTLDFKGKKVFEYGVGDSTTWFRCRGCNVYGVDNDQVYAYSRQVYHETDCTKFVMSIYRPPVHLYDIVIIDGEFRDECTEHALACLKTGGYLIIDNYKQPSVSFIWTETEEAIKGMPITIYKEPNHKDWQTAVITKQ